MLKHFCYERSDLDEFTWSMRSEREVLFHSKPVLVADKFTGCNKIALSEIIFVLLLT
jgi:hypothetical protein